ncbi:ER membrane protein complex subunit 1 [Elysia marginata]|uniref:ER membrane protein complex subunit 1 n=1 Tax=Elysia marginata TaxID=1093978 RepID=A0AAV4IAD6_9GAST|nr:ER membrane protein complex subunit 1 [Elysia marginata]
MTISGLIAETSSIMAVTGSIVFFAIFVGISYALFADQAGLFDWKQDFVGKVKFLHWEQSPSAGKKVLLASEKNAIASVNAHDGSIVWRKIFEPDRRGRIDAFLHYGSAVISVHAGGQFVRSWQAASGSLNWEKSLTTDSASWASAFLLEREGKPYRIIVTTSSTMHCLKLHDGVEEWRAELPNSCVIMEDSKHFVCYSSQSSSLQLLSLEAASVFIATDLKALGVETSAVSQIEAVVPELGSTVMFRSQEDKLVLMSLTSQQAFSVHKVLDKTYTAEVMVHGEKYILLTLTQGGTESLKLTGIDFKAGTEMDELSQTFPFAHYHGHPTTMYPFLFTKKKDSSNKPACKLLFASQDYSLHYVQKNKAQWRREESLSYILTVQMVDLPVSENQAKFEDEFGTKEEDIFAMFIKRLKAQFSQLKVFTVGLMDRVMGHTHHYTVSSDAIEEEEPEEEDLVRDDFNLHKIIVVATASGKIYGIRSHTGKIAWQQFIPDLMPFERYGQHRLLLMVQRTTAHFPHAPQCTVLGVSKQTGNGLLISFNPVTGALLSGRQGQGLDLGYKVVQAEMLAEMDDEFLKGLILIDDHNKPHIYPESSQSVFKSLTMQLFFHLLNTETGIMTGYRLTPEASGLSLDEVWTLDLQKSQQTITGVYSKRAIDLVHSQGRVLGDRSVLYKYLNPNLVAVVAEGEEHHASSTTKGPSGFFSIYMIDGVTGHIVYHQTHKRSRGPVKVIHAENWVVYTYFNEKYRRNEVGVLELYEGRQQSNSTAFSSFSPPPPPLVMRQAYIFPEPVYAMASTVTEKGITSKNIICKEEGTIPYVPEIPLSTEALVNYNRSIFNVDGVFTSPAGLESTSLVFVHGIDIFYTRVMPSRMFDVLKEDFDYLFIGSVLGLMILVSFITQKLAARKALNRAWK